MILSLIAVQRWHAGQVVRAASWHDTGLRESPSHVTLQSLLSTVRTRLTPVNHCCPRVSWVCSWKDRRARLWMGAPAREVETRPRIATERETRVGLP